jgi:hypothetical protein
VLILAVSRLDRITRLTLEEYPMFFVTYLRRELRRRMRQATSVLTAALAGAALLAAACGGGTALGTAPPAPRGVTNSTDNADGVAYTQCMRKDGVPNFPDPNSHGKVFNGAYLKQAGVDLCDTT